MMIGTVARDKALKMLAQLVWYWPNTRLTLNATFVQLGIISLPLF